MSPDPHKNNGFLQFKHANDQSSPFKRMQGNMKIHVWFFKGYLHYIFLVMDAIYTKCK